MEAISIERLSRFAGLVVLGTPEGVREQIVASARDIERRAAELSLAPQELFKLHRLLYAADTSAYTYDAVATNQRRAVPGLDFLFEFNPSFRREVQEELLLRSDSGVRFSPAVHALVEAIGKEVLGYSPPTEEGER